MKLNFRLAALLHGITSIWEKPPRGSDPIHSSVDHHVEAPGRNATKRVGYKARLMPVGHRKAFKMPVKLRWALKAIGAANRSAARSGVRAPYWPDCKGL